MNKKSSFNFSQREEILFSLSKKKIREIRKDYYYYQKKEIWTYHRTSIVSRRNGAWGTCTEVGAEDDREGRPNRRPEGGHPTRSRRTLVVGGSLGLSPSSPVSDPWNEKRKWRMVSQGRRGAQKPRNTRSLFSLKRNANNKTLRQSRGRVSTSGREREKKRGSIRELGGNKGFRGTRSFGVSDALPFCVISGGEKRKQWGGLLFRGWLQFDKNSMEYLELSTNRIREYTKSTSLS